MRQVSVMTLILGNWADSWEGWSAEGRWCAQRFSLHLRDWSDGKAIAKPFERTRRQHSWSGHLLSRKFERAARARNLSHSPCSNGTSVTCTAGSIIALPRNRSSVHAVVVSKFCWRDRRRACDCSSASLA